MSEGERQKFEAAVREVLGWPETVILKRWEDGSYFGSDIQRMEKLWKLARAEQPSQTRAAEGWISVLDRLPNVEDKLLVLDDAAYVHMAYHRPDSETYRFDCDTYGLKISDVTHWMYVPEPPNAAAVPVEDRPYDQPRPKSFSVPGDSDARVEDRPAPTTEQLVCPCCKSMARENFYSPCTRVRHDIWHDAMKWSTPAPEKE